MTDHQEPPGPPPGYQPSPAPSWGEGYPSKTPWQREVDDGQVWAYLSYGSMFVGFPLFIIPMVQKDNRFALFHAKQAAVAFILMLALTAVTMALAFMTCGVGAVAVPLIFLAWVPAIHGFIIATNGRMDEPALSFGLAERLFSGLQATPKAAYAPPPSSSTPGFPEGQAYGAPAPGAADAADAAPAEAGSSSTGYKAADWEG